MPPWGRPLGRREREQWERYQQRLYDEQRVQELSSDEDRHGVSYGIISKKSRSVSDELFFNDGASRYPRTHSDEHLAYGERYDTSEEEDEDEDMSSSLEMVKRNQELLLAQRALDRIERAKAKGKPAVNLTHEEIEALERRYTRESPERLERARKRSSPKGKRSPSTSNGAWTRRKTSRRPSLLASANVPPKQRVIKSGKKDQDEVYPTGAMPPGFMIPGPGGAPVYSPLGYYNAQPSARRTVSAENPSPPNSRGSSRSASNSSRHAPVSPAYEGPPYPHSRHYNDPRPLSQSQRTSSLPKDSEYFQPPYSEYQTYPPPGRRIASGPPDVSYSNVYRRVPPSTSSRGRMHQSTSDPGLLNERGPSGLGNEYEITSSESEDLSEDELAPPTMEPVYESRSGGSSSRPRRRR